jgi:hypothetical protein
MKNLTYSEFSFSLPQGFIDSQGNYHKKGKIRAATGEDEIFVSKDIRVRDNSSYSVFIMLSRLITGLGSMTRVTPQELENLFLKDFYYLQKIYNQINSYPQEVNLLGE